MVKVSFIIPSYNSHLTIEKTIQSVFRQQPQEHIAEVIVVDSSDDGKTRDIFKKFDHPKLKVLSLNQKTSPSAGRNMGAKLSQGTLLCFIDSDVFLSDDWLSNILDAFKKVNGDSSWLSEVFCETGLAFVSCEVHRMR